MNNEFRVFKIIDGVRVEVHQLECVPESDTGTFFHVYKRNAKEGDKCKCRKATFKKIPCP